MIKYREIWVYSESGCKKELEDVAKGAPSGLRYLQQNPTFMDSASSIAYLVVVVFITGISILLMRLLGAWMFRINEVITLLKSIRSELKKSNENRDQSLKEIADMADSKKVKT